MKDDLSALSTAEIDALPFGYIALAPDGTIRKYNRYEADLARTDPSRVLGRNFFRDVAPCTQVREFEGRFREFVDSAGEPTLSFDFEFAFHHGAQRVRIGLVRSPLPGEIIVTVNRVRDLTLSLSAHLTHDPLRGRLRDAAGHVAVVLGEDFLAALAGQPAEIPGRFGQAWGIAHALRVESLVQREHGTTLREAEIQLALECLSGSLGVVGLGRFECDLSLRSRGLLLVRHFHSPFAELAPGTGAPSCALLAGLHAGFFSYLAGRELLGREVVCSGGPQSPCVFAIGVAARLERLFEPAAGSADADLLVALGHRPRVEAL